MVNFHTPWLKLAAGQPHDRIPRIHSATDRMYQPTTLQRIDQPNLQNYGQVCNHCGLNSH